MEHVIATDPGGRSGWASAAMVPDGFELTGSGVLREDFMPDFFGAEQGVQALPRASRAEAARLDLSFQGPTYDVFVYESWYPRPDENGSMQWIQGDNLAEAQQIGALRWIARASGAKIVTQHPSDKTMATATMPDVLKVLDRDSSEQHDRDARMHLWLYFWRNWFTGEHSPGSCVHV
jgi:hypothetical protein